MLASFCTPAAPKVKHTCKKQAQYTCCWFAVLCFQGVSSIRAGFDRTGTRLVLTPRKRFSGGGATLSQCKLLFALLLRMAEQNQNAELIRCALLLHLVPPVRDPGLVSLTFDLSTNHTLKGHVEGKGGEVRCGPSD